MAGEPGSAGEEAVCQRRSRKGAGEDFCQGAACAKVLGWERSVCSGRAGILGLDWGVGVWGKIKGGLGHAGDLGFPMSGKGVPVASGGYS